MLVQAVDVELDTDPAQARRRLALMDATARQNLAEVRAPVAGACLPDALDRLTARHTAALDVTGSGRGPAGLRRRRPHRVRPRDGCGFSPPRCPADTVRRGSGRRYDGDRTPLRPRRREGRDRVIRIVPADDHPAVREGLRAMLSAEPDPEVVGDAASGARAEALAAELRPDVVLMDLRVPDGSGVESIVRMTAAGLPCRVIVLTAYETDRDILWAVEAGAAGCLLKDLPRRSRPGWWSSCAPVRSGPG